MAESTTPDAMPALTRRWADMVLEDEETAFQPVADDVGEEGGGAKMTWRVVGRFLTKTLIKIEYMRQALASVWKPVRGMRVSKIQPRLFLFVFYHRADMVRVLEEGPWAFENATLVCREVVDGALPTNVALDSVDMWIQVYDLPLGYTSDKILEQIGNFLSIFIKGDNRFAGALWKTFHRIRVSLSVDKPIRRRMKFVKRDKSTCWVTFKYKRLHNFCFYCGMIGHVYKLCAHARDATIPVENYPFSNKLRADDRRGPRAVGESWLLPTEGAGGVEDSTALFPNVDVVGTASAARRDTDMAVVAVAKRRREGEGGSERGLVGGDEDVLMSEGGSKSLHMAGFGSQTRPTQ
ncbi:PREDICTED: uncharacterized protein LOC109185224 [Ipomoea nil]|uniref:uncharacterized protein LOC109185224 n=1 Tax=Ipomoea nil TaxID=35883 RepID=UPI0009013205|nr:PREDICTED: uncharacterized protein LOC109185224 [Ipomoea nil]